MDFCGEGFTNWQNTLNKIDKEIREADKLKNMINLRRGPVLIIDLYHNIEGKIIPIREIEKILKKDKGVHRIILFNCDPLEIYIPDITTKLMENIEKLREWTIIFTDSDKYLELDEFQRFMKNSDSVGEIILD